MKFKNYIETHTGYHTGQYDHTFDDYAKRKLSKRISAIGGRIGNRHRRIAKYAMPISCILILIALFLLYFFPPF